MEKIESCRAKCWMIFALVAGLCSKPLIQLQLPRLLSLRGSTKTKYRTVARISICSDLFNSGSQPARSRRRRAREWERLSRIRICLSLWRHLSFRTREGPREGFLTVPLPGGRRLPTSGRTCKWWEKKKRRATGVAI